MQLFYNGHKHTMFRTCPVRFGSCATGRNPDGSIQGTVYLTGGNAGKPSFSLGCTCYPKPLRTLLPSTHTRPPASPDGLLSSHCALAKPREGCET